jgi:hypothetical protein
MNDGVPQLVIAEGKAGDSALTALGANSVGTLRLNLQVIRRDIVSMPDSAVRTELLRQLDSRAYTVELYVSPSNLVSTPRRVDEILMDRLQQPASRVVLLPRSEK